LSAKLQARLILIQEQAIINQSTMGNLKNDQRILMSLVTRVAKLMATTRSSNDATATACEKPQ
jgi:hypothetical protein